MRISRLILITVLFLGTFLPALAWPAQEPAARPASPAGEPTTPISKSKDQAQETDKKPGEKTDKASSPDAGNVQRSSVEILSDTQGMDFGPYLQKAVSTIKSNWYLLIPEIAKNKVAETVIEFAILKDGRVAGLHITNPSGYLALDRPAYGAVVNSNPFASLPPEFKGQFLELRVRFQYNPSNESKKILPLRNEETPKQDKKPD